MSTFANMFPLLLCTVLNNFFGRSSNPFQVCRLVLGIRKCLAASNFVWSLAYFSTSASMCTMNTQPSAYVCEGELAVVVCGFWPGPGWSAGCCTSAVAVWWVFTLPGFGLSRRGLLGNAGDLAFSRLEEVDKFLLWQWCSVLSSLLMLTISLFEKVMAPLSLENVDQTSWAQECLEHPQFHPRSMGWMKTGSQRSHPSCVSSYWYTTTRSDTLYRLANTVFCLCM